MRYHRSQRPRGSLLAGLTISALVMASCSSSPSSTTRRTTTTSMAHPTTTSAPRPSSSTMSSTTTPPAPVPESLSAIAFFTPTSGYGVFTKQGVVSCEDLVGSTTDGGATFGPLVPVTSWVCATGATVDSLSFDDHGDGFLYGPDLEVTHDGGKSWQQSTQPGAVLSVQALGLSVWMVESGCPSNATAQTCPLRLFESADGGRTWSPSPSLPAGAVASSDGAESTWLVRVSQSSAYLVLNPAANPQGQADEAPLWFTANGGASWSARSIPCGFDALSIALSAAPDGTLLAVCAGQPSAGSQLKSTVRSSDSGLTWTVQSSCPMTGSGQPSCVHDPINFGYLGEIDAVSADVVFLVGGRSSLMVSTNGGVQWQAVQPLIGDTSDGTQQVIFFNTTDGVVLGDNGDESDESTLWSTRDGGAQWTAVVPRVS